MGIQLILVCGMRITHTDISWALNGGASYHSSKSARDRDRLRQQVLEGLGWTFYRIWSTDWFNNPKTEFRKLKQALEKRKDYLCKRVEDDSGIVLVDQNLTGEPEITADVANDLQEGNDDSVTQSILFQDPIASGAFPDKVLLEQLLHWSLKSLTFPTKPTRLPIRTRSQTLLKNLLAVAVQSPKLFWSAER